VGWIGRCLACKIIPVRSVAKHAVQVVGRIDKVREQIFAITTERKLTHPIVAAICRFAQHDVFGGVLA